MVDGSLTIQIDHPLAARLAVAAAARGVAIDTFVRNALAGQLELDEGWNHDPDPAIDEAIADEAERTGDLVPAGDVVDWMRSWFTPDELPMPTQPPRR